MQYDPFKGVIAYIRLFEGSLNKNEVLQFIATQTNFEATEIGVFTPNMQVIGNLHAGNVGYVVTNLKDIHKVKIGDTLTTSVNPTRQPLMGYKESKSMVFASFYPTDNNYEDLKNVIQRLALNDSSFIYKEDKSEVLGRGFRCGFLGMLHLQIIRERLEKEYCLSVLTTAPNIAYHVILKNGQKVWVNNPVDYPSFELIECVEEPPTWLSL